jgi:hypothetical protein
MNSYYRKYGVVGGRELTCRELGSLSIDPRIEMNNGSKVLAGTEGQTCTFGHADSELPFIMKYKIDSRI